jgi:Tc toxin complex TcA C-terminal TcB-binding domain/Neuraminidase-like domain/Salmonella virulence plasmid 28.1kDa A protein
MSPAAAFAHDPDVLAQILAENASLRLDQLDFGHGSGVASLRYRAQPLQHAHVELLKAAQRVHRVCDGDVDARDALLRTGYDSAHRIARTSRRAFVRDVAASVGAQRAKQLHLRARHVRTMTMDLVANVRGLMGSRYYAGTMFSSVRSETVEEFQSLPGFAELFGNLDYLQCEDCQSILSPAAYLVDLMRIVETYVDNPSLKQRRPDLYTIELTCENTNTVVPYLSIVNRLLESTIVQLAVPAVTDAYEAVAMVPFPFSVPYHRPLAQLRAYLDAMNVGYVEVLKALANAQGVTISSHEIARERLRLSQESAALISTPNASALGIAAAYGLAPMTGIGSVTVNSTDVTGSATWFKTRLTPGDLITVGNQYRFVKTVSSDAAATVDMAWASAAATQAFSITQTGALRRVSGSGLVTINADTNVAGTGQAFAALKPGDLIVVGAQYRTVVTVASANAAIVDQPWSTASANQPFTIVPASSASKVAGVGTVTIATDDKVAGNGTSFKSCMNPGDILSVGGQDRRVAAVTSDTSASVDAPWAQTASNQSFTIVPAGQLANVGAFLAKTGLSFAQLDELLSQGIDSKEPDRDQRAAKFFINDTGETPAPPPLRMAWTKSDAGSLQALQNLSMPRFDRLARFIRLKNATGWTSEQLDYVLKVLGASELANDVLVFVGTLLDFCKRLALPIDAVWLLIGNLKPYGAGGAITLQDQFDLKFNDLGLLGPANPYTQPKLLFNPANAPSWDPSGKTDPDGQNAAIRARLSAALAVNDADLTLAGGFALQQAGEQQKLPLSLENLSGLARIARLAAALDLSIPDCVQLAGFFVPSLGKQDRTATDAVADLDAFVGFVHRMQAAHLTPAQLADITNGVASVDDAAVLAMIGRNAAQAQPSRVTVKSLTSCGLADVLAAEVSALLQLQAFVTADGNLADKPFGWAEAASLVAISPGAFIGPLVSAADDAATQLVTSGVLKAAGQTGRYNLAKPFDPAADLSALFPSNLDERSAMIEEVRKVLVTLEQNVDQLVALLGTLPPIGRLRGIQQQVAAAGLAQLFGCQPALVPQLINCAQIITTFPDLTATLLSTAPQTPVGLPLGTFLRDFGRCAMLARTLSLTASEIGFVAAYPQCLGAAQFSDLLQATGVLQIATCKTLIASFNDTDDRLIAFFEIPAGTKDAQALALGLLTSWSADQVAAMLTFVNDQMVLTVANLAQLARIADVARRIGASVGQLRDIGQISTQPLGAAGVWDNWSAVSRALLGAVRSMGTEASFAGFKATIAAALLPHDRDGLVGVAMSLLNTQPGIDGAIASYEDLFDYLLIDAEMGAAATTSIIAQAISSVQVYLQRVRIGMEAGAAIDGEFKPVWWTWLSSYRVWQANREIFLFPENYIDPTLRRGKSDIFGNFASALLQTDINDAAVTESYTDYVNELEVRASLQHCAAFHYVPDPGKAGTETTYIFARTNAAPFDYYYRTWDADGLWGTWRKVNVKIASAFITPVFAFNRLFIFWIELEQTKSSVVMAAATSSTLEAASKDLSSVKGNIKYSFLNVSDTWSPPQTLLSDAWPIDFQLDYDHSKAIDEAIGPTGKVPFTDKLTTANLPWQQIQAVRLMPQPVDQEDVLNPWQSERILINFGMGLRFKSGATLAPPNNISDEQTFNPDHKAFNGAIYDFLTRYNQSIGISNATGLVQYHPLITLDWTLTRNQYPALLMDYVPVQDPLPYGPVLDRGNGVLGVAFSTSVLNAEYYSDDSPAWPLPVVQNTNLLKVVSGANASVVTVKNQPGWFIFNNGDEAFLVQSQQTGAVINGPQSTPLKTLDQIIAVANSNVFVQNGPPNVMCLYCTAYVDTSTTNIVLTEIPFQFTRLTTALPTQLSNFLIGGGIAALLSPAAQQIPEPDFASRYQPASDQVLVPQSAPDHADFDGAFGPYLWEVFFHGPMLVGNRLNTALRFEEAKRWFEYIFDPTASPEDGGPWRFLAFRGQSPDDLKAMLQSKAQIAAYDNDPFDPDTIAMRRTSAYAKAVAMAYVGNLLDWADSYFAADTAESINEAMLIYALVSDLLGPRPQQVGTVSAPRPLSFYDIQSAYKDDIPQFYIEMEQFQVHHGMEIVAIADAPFDLDAYFCVPENDQLIGYWTRLEDRLYKIRHSMNLQGVVQSLALFAPPIDPRALIRAAAAGTPIGIGGVDLAPVPHYRFAALVERARMVAGQVTTFGDALLSALEKRDAAQLEQIRNTQEGSMLNLTRQAKAQRLLELEQTRLSLAQGRLNATRRSSYYQSQLKQGLNPGEVQHLSATFAGNVLNIAGGALRVIAGASYLIPNAGSPFAMTFGGKQIGHALEAESGELELAGKISMMVAELSLTNAQYDRRAQEWQLQADLADYDGRQIDAQLAANAIESQVAQNDLDAHNASIAGNAQIADVLTSRFTSQDLYQWMAGCLSEVYFQAFTMASDLARSAESAYRFELNSTQTFVNSGYWSSERQGLTAGHQLVAALLQMEKSHVDNNVRTLEIERTISLRDLDPLALMKLKQQGECMFSLGEMLFDLDFPGHYLRKVKTLSLSIPAVLPPYQNINATLTQLSSQIVLTSDGQGGLGAVEFLLGGTKDAKNPGPGALQSNASASQAIALSRGIDDFGLFELSFNDERYLPFEGTGAVSTWRLSLPRAANRFSFDAISDVIVKLHYTAVDGGEEFRSNVTGLDVLKTYQGAQVYNLAQTYPAEWHGFMTGPKSDAGQQFLFTLDSGLVPPNVAPSAIRAFKLLLDLNLPQDKNAIGDKAYIELAVPGQSKKFLVNPDAQNWCDCAMAGVDLKAALGQPLTITFNGDTPGILLLDDLLDPSVLRNMFVLILYEGALEWPAPAG